jgi:LmbE family N-acetylglucosaminyl deacetylase
MVTPFAEGVILRGCAQAPTIGIEALTNLGAVLVLTPHPDDETLGCGGALAAAADRGVDITIACITDGAGSHPASFEYPHERLAELRLAELRKAVGALSSDCARVISLGLPDQGVTPERLSESRIYEQLLCLAREKHIRAIWTTWHRDPHVDHRAAACIAFEMTKDLPDIMLWEFPVWGRFLEEEDLPDDFYVFDSRPFLVRKRAAIQAYASQMTTLIKDDPLGFTMEPQVQAHFLEWPEIFIRGQAT